MICRLMQGAERAAHFKMTNRNPDFSAFEALSFDCYGTLIDWEAGILTAVQPVLRRRAITLNDETLLEHYARIESAAQPGAFRLYREVLRDAMRALGQLCGFAPEESEVNCIVASLPSWHPFADTVTALHQFKRRFRLAIVSNVDDDLFLGTSRQLGVEFDAVVTAQQVRSYKPATRHWEVLLDRLQLPRERVLHVAQSLFHDIAPARQLGFHTVWVNRRASPGATPPAEARPDIAVPDLSNLVRLVEASFALPIS
jgi:2-haloacid dehalogenase